jgi:hypothetical protein
MRVDDKKADQGAKKEQLQRRKRSIVDNNREKVYEYQKEYRNHPEVNKKSKVKVV